MWLELGREKFGARRGKGKVGADFCALRAERQSPSLAQGQGQAPPPLGQPQQPPWAGDSNGTWARLGQFLADRPCSIPALSATHTSPWKPLSSRAPFPRLLLHPEGGKDGSLADLSAPCAWHRRGGKLSCQRGSFYQHRLHPQSPLTFH